MYKMPVDIAIRIREQVSREPGESTTESHAQWTLIRLLQEQVAELQAKVARLEGSRVPVSTTAVEAMEHRS